MATRKDLHEALRRIGWEMQHIGCSIYAVITPDSKQTNWQCDGDESLTLRCSSAFGGIVGCTRGTASFQLKRCIVRIGKEGNAIHVGPARDRNAAFVSFYNFDLPKGVKR